MIPWWLFFQILWYMIALAIIICAIIGKIGDERVRLLTVKHKLDIGEDPEKGSSTVYRSP